MEKKTVFNATQFWKRADGLMKMNNRTITELSQKMGHSKTFLSTCKTRGVMKASTVMELAQALGCSSDYLLGLTDAFRPVEYDRSDNDRLIAVLLKMLDEDQKEVLIERIGELSEKCAHVTQLYSIDPDTASGEAAVEACRQEGRLRDLDGIETAAEEIVKAVMRLRAQQDSSSRR